jgi:hypothetical protein
LKPISLYNFFLVLAIILISASCSNNDPKFISEGVIEYDAKAVDVNHPMATLAPGSMSVRFKNDMYCSEMSTMGVFTTTFIADPKKKTLTQMVKVFEEKTACIENDKIIAEENAKYKLILKETKDTKIIAGYKCKRVIATMDEDPTIKFDVYYTDGINVKNSNFSNPYSSLKGMLMQFRLKKFGLEMEFTAKSVKKEDIPDNIFELPAYYKIVSKQAMDEFFKSIQ